MTHVMSLGGRGSGLASRFAAETCPEIAAALVKTPVSNQARQSSAVREDLSPTGMQMGG